MEKITYKNETLYLFLYIEPAQQQTLEQEGLQESIEIEQICNEAGDDVSDDYTEQDYIEITNLLKTRYDNF